MECADIFVCKFGWYRGLDRPVQGTVFCFEETAAVSDDDIKHKKYMEEDYVQKSSYIA